jgi:hypothetical protein
MKSSPAPETPRVLSVKILPSDNSHFAESGRVEIMLTRFK